MSDHGASNQGCISLHIRSINLLSQAGRTRSGEWRGQRDHVLCHPGLELPMIVPQ